MKINNIELTSKDNNWFFWSHLKNFCSTPELIEGFDIVWTAHLNGEVFKQKYCCHHRAEILESKSKTELIEEERYYNRPPEELIIMLSSDHTALHNKYRKTMLGKHHSEDTKKKIAEAQKDYRWWTDGKTNRFSKDCPEGFHKGMTLSDKTKRTLSEKNKGKITSIKGKHWYTDGLVNVQAIECPEGFRPGVTQRKTR